MVIDTTYIPVIEFWDKKTGEYQIMFDWKRINRCHRSIQDLKKNNRRNKRKRRHQR